MGEFYDLDKNPQYDVDTIRRRKRQLKMKKKKKRFKTIIFLILIVGMIIGAGLSPFFNVVNISVEDTPHYTGDEIKAYALSLESKNGFKAIFENYVDSSRAFSLRLAAIEDKLSHTLTYANEVKVSYIPPARIDIKIKERKPFAVVSSGDKMILVDKSGFVLEEIKQNINNYVQINGIENVKTTVGGYFCTEPKTVMNTANNLMSVLSDIDNGEQNKLVPKIISINLADIRRVKLFVDSRLIVVLGDVRNEDILRYRGNYLRQLVYKNLGNKEKGTIDFTMGEYQRFIPDKMD